MTGAQRAAAMLFVAAGALSLAGCGAGDDAGIDDMLQATQVNTGLPFDAGHCPAPAQARTDANITQRILTALAADPALRGWQIAVDTSDGKVVLHGSVPNGPLRERATRIALAVPGVTLVDSLLDIHG